MCVYTHMPTGAGGSRVCIYVRVLAIVTGKKFEVGLTDQTMLGEGNGAFATELWFSDKEGSRADCRAFVVGGAKSRSGG